MRLNHLLLLIDSKWNCWYIFSWEVPFKAHVMARDMLYWIVSILLHGDSFSGWSHHHSRNGASQKNKRLLKSDSHLPKKLCSLLHWKPFKNDEKGFLFHLQSSFRSQDIKFLSQLFGHVAKTTWLQRQI